MQFLRRLLTLLCALGLASSIGFGQSDTAQLSGFVRDTSDAVIPNASVTVRNESVALERRTSTNGEGYFAVPNLPPGFYTITVEATGFKRFIRSGQKLDASMAASVNAKLELGATSDSIEVVASATPLQSDSSAVGQLIERSQIENMMLNGRNAVLLANLKPGVQGGILSRFSFGLDNGSLSINGSRPQENLITYDGAPAVRTRGNDNSIGSMDLDNVQEVQVLTANYNAEYGRANGGQIRIVTRSGGPQFHGTLFEYLRNDALDANTWARNAVTNNKSLSGSPAPLRFIQFGYNLNGPLAISPKWRNKVFWLWGQEWVRYRPTNMTSQTVPSLAMRRGDFSELLNAANPFFGKVRLVNDPTTNQPFAGNIIPASQVSKNGLGLLRSYPEPTTGYLLGTANWLANVSAPTNQRKDTFSVDFVPTSNQSLRFRGQNFSLFESNPLLYNSDRVGMIRSRPNKVASVTHTWTITPTLVNEFLASGSVDRVNADIDRSMNRWDRAQYGIDFPYVFPGQKQVENKIPWATVSGFLQMNGGPYPARSAGPIYVFSDNLTKVIGQHTLKFGFSFEYAGQNNFDLNNANCFDENGCFSFTDARSGSTTSGVAVANVALGLFTTYLEPSQKVYVPYRGKQWEAFAQDSWKVTSKLRLEYGVRYSVVQPWYSQWNNQAAFDARYYDPSQAAIIDPKTGLVLGGNRLNGMVITGSSWPSGAVGRVPAASNTAYNSLFRGASREYSQMHYLNFQPRVGFAWQFASKNVLRGGFGKFLARPGISGGYPMGANPPLLNVASFTNGNVDTPGGNNPVASPYALGTQDSVFKIPAAYNWNITMERELPFGSVLQVAYVGRVGLWGQRARNINQLPAGTVQANPGVAQDALRPYKGYSSIELEEYAARSKYDGLQIGVNRRFANRLGFGVAYTFSRSNDNASSPSEIISNAYNDTLYWGHSSFDIRHMFVTNFVYDLPAFSRSGALYRTALGGWQVSGVVQAQTGTPFTVATSDDFAGVGPGSGSQFWNVNGDPTLGAGDRAFSSGVADQNYYIRTKTANGGAMYTSPTLGTFGNQIRNSVYNPGLQSWNLALFKTFKIRESHNLQFRADAYNFINHPNWGSTDSNPRSGTFGKVTSKSSNRQMQVSLRYQF